MTMTQEELDEKRVLAEKLQLKGRYLLWNSPLTVGRICNGIGAEWMPETLRKAISGLHKSLRLAADIHDLAYAYGAGTESDFRRCNSDFLANGLTLADHYYGWWNPVRYIARASARNFYKLLQIGGRFAYYAAIEERRNAAEAEK